MTMNIIGLMSGTSADGIDAALVKIKMQQKGKLHASLMQFLVARIPHQLKRDLFCLFEDQKGSLSLVCQLNFQLGQIFAHAVKRLLKKAGVTPDHIDAIGSHGQTVYHIPHFMAMRRNMIPSTLQIGDSSVIALETGITTVADFRVADMAVGGEGAPLIPFADFHLLSSQHRTRIVQNIGGIANCTILPADSSIESVSAFDTGPGNMIIDGVIRSVTDNRLLYDKNGSFARHGKVYQPLLRRLLAHPYFDLSPPKTTGRELFGEHYVRNFLKMAHRAHLSVGDMVATATALTAESIIQAYTSYVFPEHTVDEIILGGGGAYNKTLFAMLRERLPSRIRLLQHEDVGINAKAKEAIGFALLAYACLNNIPANLPSATGAQRPVILGKIYRP